MSPLFNDIYLSLEIIESVIVNMYSVIILKRVNKVELFMSTCLTSLKYSSLLTIAKALPYRSCLPMMIWLQLLRRHCRRCFPSLIATINRRKLQIIISKHLISKFQLFDFEENTIFLLFHNLYTSELSIFSLIRSFEFSISYFVCVVDVL